MPSMPMWEVWPVVASSVAIRAVQIATRMIRIDAVRSAVVFMAPALLSVRQRS